VLRSCDVVCRLGTVRLTFAQPKQAMILLRDLAANNPHAFDNLCIQFDAATSDGADMSHYDELLREALASIENTFRKKATAGLLSGRDAVLPTAKETPEADGDDFDLVTWLVILESKS